MTPPKPLLLKLPGYVWFLLPVLCGLAVSALFFRISGDRDAWVWWSRWVPFVRWPTFSDLTLTMDHLRLSETGFDVLADPETDFAYPRAVLALRHLGIQHMPSEWLGLFHGLVFTLGIVLVLRPFTWRRGIGAAFVLLTPAIVLGFERANIDLLLFPLCAAAAWFWSRRDGAVGMMLAILTLMAGAVLKIYPVFGLLAAACAETPKRRIYWMLGTAAVAFYWFLDREEIALVMSKVAVMTVSSWGCVIIFTRLQNYLMEAAPDLWLANVNWGMVALGLYGVAALAAVGVGRRWAGRFRSVQWLEAEWCYYWVGAGICCGCFAGANFVYRWAFAVLTLPLLVRSARSADKIVATWARVTIAAMLVGLGAKFSLPTVPFVFVQLANWVCILGLLVGCSALLAAAKEGEVVAGELEAEDLAAGPVRAKS